MLPTFLVIGAMKAGTSSLHTFLAHHPQIFMSEVKEINYFVPGMTGNMSLEDYQAHFADADAVADLRVVGESSPSYTMCTAFKGVPGRIAETLTDPRFIYVMREPIARAQSNYLHALRKYEKRSIDEALRKDYRYLDASRYFMQASAYIDLFGRDKLLLLTAEELKTHRGETLAKVYEFLGVDPSDTATNLPNTHDTASMRIPRPSWPTGGFDRVARAALPERLHTRLATTTLDPHLADLAPDTLEWVRGQLAPDVAALRDLMPPGFDGWGIA